jgi:hypothetical protein
MKKGGILSFFQPNKKPAQEQTPSKASPKKSPRSLKRATPDRSTLQESEANHSSLRSASKKIKPNQFPAKNPTAKSPSKNSNKMKEELQIPETKLAPPPHSQKSVTHSTKSGNILAKSPTKAPANGKKTAAPKMVKDFEYKKSYKQLDDKTYDCTKDAPFNAGEPVPFHFIVEAFDILEKTKGKDSAEYKKRVITNMFITINRLTPNELGNAYLFCTLRIDSEFQQDDIGIGNQTILKAMKTATGRDLKSIKASLTEIGDWGQVMQNSKANQDTMDTFFKAKAKTARLTFDYVFDKIRQMGKLHGTKANLTKESYLEELLFAGEPNETKFVIRFLQKNFKMGAAEMFMQSSLARAFYLEKEWGPEHNQKMKTNVFVAVDNLETLQHWEKSLQKVINQYPYHAKVIESLQSVDSIDELKEFCHLVPGIPCKPQLAKPTKDISIIFKRFENMPFTCEFKYDGLRGQIHFKDGKCDIFSR